jgi:hypothetical protein
MNWTNIRLKLLVGIAASVSLGGLSAVLLFGGNRADEAAPAESRVEFASVDQLVAASDMILVGVLKSESREQVREPSPVDSSHADTRVDVVRVFSVTEVIKGTPPSSGTVEARAAESGRLELPGGTTSNVTYEVVPLKGGSTYILFLRRLADPAIGQFWGLAGEPGVAEVKLGKMIFSTTPGFARDLQRRGVVLGASGAGPAFDVTLDQVKTAAAKQNRPSP